MRHHLMQWRTTQDSGVDRQPLILVALCTGLLAFLVYILTLAPTFGWGDSADLAMRMVFAHDPTFRNTTRDYVLYRAAAGLFQSLPFGDAGYRANLATAFFGAVTITLVSWFAGLVARNIMAGCIAGLSLMVAHSFWLMSVIAEVYTFNTSLIFACFLCMAYWWQQPKPHSLCGAAIFAGLALSHHATGLLLAASLLPLLWLHRKSLRKASSLAALLLYCAAAWLYWIALFERLAAGAPVLKAVGLLNPSNPFFDAAPLREFLKFLGFAGYNFFGLAGLLALLGAYSCWRQKPAILIPSLCWFGCMVFAGITSSIPDKFNIYILAYPVLALLAGLGYAHSATHFSGWRMRGWALALLLLAVVCTPPLAYRGTILVTNAAKIDIIGARKITFRDNAWYFLWPPKNDDYGPRLFATHTLHALPEHAIILADYTLWRPLYFLQAVEQVRQDVTIAWVERIMARGSVAAFVAQTSCDKALFLATDSPPEYYQLPQLQQHVTLQPQNGLIRVLRPTCGEHS